ncbi:hypothetical protein AOL_s00211g2 [Orbilia oligospora ATCC 24927]|uniref:Uncharacterized protein n=1 Tax=Arthrobotrys oligospora (strain ATCC 24927 / CBS 115.81 / DSM 1491) TaxID=756982 RepID=G1XSN7_ARTOA|nr:hypothetical protein AOL_s00211g2 [Orbilia oligospora ATCC 24927]EGX43840.1 hypothetical protein AOL_s00211g2 [Orbilia oligospora ATCC 24927]
MVGESKLREKVGCHLCIGRIAEYTLYNDTFYLCPGCYSDWYYYTGYATALNIVFEDDLGQHTCSTYPEEPQFQTYIQLLVHMDECVQKLRSSFFKDLLTYKQNIEFLLNEHLLIYGSIPDEGKSCYMYSEIATSLLYGQLYLCSEHQNTWRERTGFVHFVDIRKNQKQPKY